MSAPALEAHHALHLALARFRDLALFADPIGAVRDSMTYLRQALDMA